MGVLSSLAGVAFLVAGEFGSKGATITREDSPFAFFFGVGIFFCTAVVTLNLGFFRWWTPRLEQ